MTDTTPRTSLTGVFDQMESMDHEQLVYCHDKATGLKAIIAIHNTTLGPAMGGTRMWNYPTEEEAVKDVTRLARGMTFKNAIAGLNAGGGKAVIIGDAGTIKSEALMRRFGRFIHGMGGRYLTAEDVNMTPGDMEYIRMETPYVAGLPESVGGSGDPSPVTAYGVYMGMKASAKKTYGSDSLEGKRILVQGVGKVGTCLVRHLVQEGARVSISDILDDKIKNITDRHKAAVVPWAKVYDTDMDIYAPCALGATLNRDSIGRLRCAIVAGGANNQLDDEVADGTRLKERGILYAPDFLINSGGITNVYHEQQGNYNRERVMAQTEKIYDVCLSVIRHAENNHTTTHEAALDLALQRIESVSKIKLAF